MVQCNPYAMKIDRERNCYDCRGFGHIVQHYRNRGQGSRAMEGRRLEYRGKTERNYEHSDNLKEEENLESLN